MTAKIVSIINLKGGVGKSTLAMILGEFLVFEYGKRILLVDMDSQGNLSYCMVPGDRIQTQEKTGRTTYHMLKNALNGLNIDVSNFITRPPLIVSNIARNAAVAYPGVIDMVIATPSVAELDEELIKLWESGKPMPKNLRTSLSDALSSARDRYDYVIIDCPPGLSLFSSTALMASDFYISPVIPEPLSLQGVDLIKRRSTELNSMYHHNIQFKGVILNIVKHYRNTHWRTAEELYSVGKKEYQPFTYWLPDSERLRKIGEFDPDLEGTWAGGVGAKFRTLYEKYGLTYRLSNPAAGLLNRESQEGQEYRLEDRIKNLVEEFQNKCH